MAACRHPLESRISYGDRAAPLGREGAEWCDVCGEMVDPEASPPEVHVHDVNGQMIETFELLDGWYHQSARRVPRYLPNGPFPSEQDALADAADDETYACPEDAGPADELGGDAWRPVREIAGKVVAMIGHLRAWR
jgi:hypothetical protein